MYFYAVSLGSVGHVMTPALEAAFRRSPIADVEISMTPYVNGEDPSGASAAATARLLEEGVIRAASCHMPFYGSDGSWDVSAPEEAERIDVVKRLLGLWQRYRALLAPEITLHGCGREPAAGEHPMRIRQLRRTLEDLLPFAEKFGIRLNVEYLPRTCIGNCEEELEEITAGFPPERVGICLDVNHVMTRYAELPAIIGKLAPKINAMHLSDYDGLDEMHWFPGQGVIDWAPVMAAVRALKKPIPLIFETQFLLEQNWCRKADPFFSLQFMGRCACYLENCGAADSVLAAFSVPRGK